jgi:hypothetical protein
MNAVILLTEDGAPQVTEMQRVEGLHDRKRLAEMSLREIIERNAEILLRAEVPERAVCVWSTTRSSRCHTCSARESPTRGLELD